LLLSNELEIVDPSWFESPVQRVSTSGGTAPFFRLVLTEEGLAELSSREQSHNGIEIDKNYWIGKDLSHAEDERDFYLQILETRSKAQSAEGDEKQRDFIEGIGLLESFMFDYLGVLRAKTADCDGNDGFCDLLVMRNLRNKLDSFRMLDLKVGEKTAQAGWKGKSRLRAMKHHLMDGLSNSGFEGYRLAGFDGCPEVFDSMDPLMDIAADKNIADGDDDTRTFWGTEVNKSQVKLAKRIMLNSMDGTEVFRYFVDLHMKESTSLAFPERYTPTEVTEIIAHELMSQLTRLSAICHRVKIPQKWIGSSVAVAYDAGFFPNRSSAVGNNEDDIRSKVIVKIFDWGRSELLDAKDFEMMTPEEKMDRNHFWDLYRAGLDRLSYNATRFYYHQFSNSRGWSKIIIQVMDFDSMSSDDYMGSIEIPLPKLSDTQAVMALKENKPYKLTGIIASTFGSTLHCSIVWMEFPPDSRLEGAWRVSIDRATNLPPMDVSRTSDPYCVVMAIDSDKNSRRGHHFHQQTCVKARNLNPEWGEKIDIPVCRKDNDSSLMSSLTGNGLSSIDEINMPDVFEWDKRCVNQKNMKLWTDSMSK